MKKYFLAIMTVVIISAIVFATGFITIGTGSVSAAAGSINVSVPVNLENNNSISILDFTLTYSRYIIFTGAQNTTRMTNATIEYYTINETTLNVAAFIPDGIQVGSGAIMNLFFNVNESALPGNSSLDMSDIVLVNVDSDNINYTVSNGIFTII